jgi:thioredoxin 1
MKKRSAELWIIIFLLIFISNACNGNNTRINSTSTAEFTQTQSATETIEPTVSDITPSLTIENSPEPTITSVPASDTPVPTVTLDTYPPPVESLPDSANTQESYPPPMGDVPANGVGQEPYPPPIGNPLATGDEQNPYPPLSGDTQYPINGESPYPGPNEPLPIQPVAINPIQTPMPSMSITVTGTVEATSTTIVSTGLKANNPATVKLASGSYQMIEFFAFWCPICKSLAPIMNGLEGEYKGRITFIYLNIDDPVNRPFKEALGYKYQPHIFLIDGEGKIIHQWEGFSPVEDFEAVLKPLFP